MEKRNSLYLAALLIPAFLLSPLTTFAAGKDAGVDYGYGAAKGMAGTEAAYPQDALVAAINPAGTAFVDDRFDASPALIFMPRGFETTAPTTLTPKLALPIGNVKSGNYFAFQPSFGFTHHLADGKSTIGFAFYTSGSGAEYSTSYTATTTQEVGPGQFRQIPLPGVYGGGTASQTLQQFFGNLSYSRKFTEHSSWGLSAILAAESLSVEGLSELSNITYTGTNSHLTNEGTDISYGIGVRGGVLIEVLPTVSIGASYQPKISMSRMAKYQNLLPNQGNLDIPANGVVGVSWKITPDNILAIDTTKTWYSTVPATSNTNYALQSQCQTGINRSYCLGGSNGPGLGFNNPVIYKIGYEYHSSPLWIWRLGFGHATPTIDSGQNILLAFATPTTENYYTAGFTHKLSKKTQFSLSFMYTPEHEEMGSNPNATGQSITLKSKMYEMSVTISRFL